MSKIFSTNVTHVRIDQLYLHTDEFSGEIRAAVKYSLIAEDGSVFQAGDGVYWETLPTPLLDVNGDPLPNPANWKALPANIIAELQNLFILAKADIESDYGITL